ncbi:MAG: ABC transporter ATP-binding protein [Pirellulales bacterium]|nr:ABC transporter ATP-binding protein [Pirellulales bacterium]
MPAIVETTDLTKRYRDVTALAACQLAIPPGEVFGLLGPNGAGKTTLLRLLMGYLQPTSGYASIGGWNCTTESVRVRQLTAYLPGETRLSRQLLGREVLDFFCRLRTGGDLNLALAIARRLDLDINRRVAFMSTGMRQKTALAAVFAFNTELIILDEPTANLDPTARGVVLQLVKEARARGKTVVFSSHVLSEVEEACDRVAVLRKGELVYEESLAQLRDQHRITLTTAGNLPRLPLEERGKINVSQLSDGAFQLDVPGDLAPLLGWLAAVPVKSMRIEPMRLQAVYERFHANTAG